MNNGKYRGSNFLFSKTSSPVLMSSRLRDLLPQGKATGTWGSPLTSIQCWDQERVELHTRSTSTPRTIFITWTGILPLLAYATG